MDYVCVLKLCFCGLDLLTVSEKAKEPPHDDSGINAPTSLALEATYINHNFSQQMLMVGHCIHSTQYNIIVSPDLRLS